MNRLVRLSIVLCIASAGVAHVMAQVQARDNLAPDTPQRLAASERALVKEVVIKANLDEAWRSWTTREGITAFLAPEADIDARVGGAFHVYFDPYAAPGFKGADDMRYMALQPPRMLSFDWNAPPSLPQARQQRTFVVLRFEPLGDRQTRVRLTHLGWGDGGEWDRAFAYFDKAWDTVFDKLHQRYETGRPTDWSEWLERLRKAHETPAPSGGATTQSR
jgi:uncharacterized protein YndB with AHSA1/START domain